jgi:hypothetical protein
VNPAVLPFGADVLTAALVLTGKVTPTPSELATALEELYPNGTGPTVTDVLAGGWLVPSIDGKRLRLPPPTPAELWPRLQAVPPKAPAVPPIAAPQFSYYRGGIASTTPYATITVVQLYTILTSPRHRAQTEALRIAPVGSPQRAKLKKRLDYVTPAGTFSRRANNGLETASGLLVLDFDHLSNLPAARAALLADELLSPELVLLFTSPGGDGLKALVKTDPFAGHLDNFRAYAAYLAAHYTALGLLPDEAGKDIARACFVPFAPDAWLAPTYAHAA